MSEEWTIERIQQLLGEPDEWPQLSVEDGEANLYLDGEQSRYSLIDEKGFCYGWIPDERLARLCAASPSALAWCMGTIEKLTAQISSENDLWVLWPSTKEMVRLRTHRKKLPSPTHKHEWEYYGDGSINEGITFRYRVCVVCRVREDLGDA